jgi:hypothetical protein
MFSLKWSFWDRALARGQNTDQSIPIYRFGTCPEGTDGGIVLPFFGLDP